jgi:hypothetical protein
MVNFANMPVSRERMEKYQNRYLNQLAHAAKQWEARENKVKNNSERRRWMQRQDNANYRNEYDRIQGDLARTRIPYGDVRKLKAREAELQRLFSSGNV